MLEIVMKKPFCLFLLFIIFSSPAFAFGTKKTMEKVMNSWSGEDINTAIEVLGYPTSEKEIANRHLFYWEESQMQFSGNRSGVYGGEYYCTRIFEVDKNNKIISWEWKGNNCPAAYLTSKKWVNPNNDPWKKDKEERKLLKQTKKEKL